MEFNFGQRTLSSCRRITEPSEFLICYLCRWFQLHLSAHIQLAVPSGGAHETPLFCDFFTTLIVTEAPSMKSGQKSPVEVVLKATLKVKTQHTDRTVFCQVAS